MQSKAQREPERRNPEWETRAIHEQDSRWDAMPASKRAQQSQHSAQGTPAVPPATNPTSSPAHASADFTNGSRNACIQTAALPPVSRLT
ncbi:hypothetical protein C8R44DRAFT_891354 [Mycena epipterygia]|nr:hypothetical protein C8R44DRAFT_891354 [Mycena epipterygia]